ncbi:TPA: hypothetical protein RPW15_001242 [Campylobacter fetus subsp. venerealis]|uniref:Uncharacterized protein n=6 Tax=Campylobacter fetus TaxID=196 RepID=A0A5L8JL26_CAMFE|nr:MULTISPECIES: hypothetical protein [Campylobacter]ABK81964.1 hypothetical protein CFF8240_0307 [Campylobacter fetus subsp. fetus 82-40]AHE93651.1 hypothetical protein CFVI03293_0306 [Campylobacter fetus subsp. venerealis cfvi03/293]OCS18814.1 hypothetical protein CFFBT1098_04255 [Campylobacter fetus subsp. fetus BT 10/98]OCS23007.1 hypothetical protein CFVI97532_01830 [Campylobacter fetus subsp. venerealis cfvi97/532]OCS27202.1 hypothetical protein CFVB10_00580 [Campylobacter fetus subsp. v
MWVIFFILFVIFCVFMIYSQMPDAVKKERTLYDELVDANIELLKSTKNPYVGMFAKEEIINLLKTISDEFDKVAVERNEVVSGNQKLFILNEIIFASGMKNKEFGIEHLHYELERYRKYGMREDNQGLIRGN